MSNSKCSCTKTRAAHIKWALILGWSASEIEEYFGTDSGTISRIKNGKLHRHVKPAPFPGSPEPTEMGANPDHHAGSEGQTHA